jgi:hypothetical protein
MKSQPLSIDPHDLDLSRAAAAAEGISWSAYAARAIRRQAIRDNLRRAAEYDKRRTPEDRAESDAFTNARAAGMAKHWVERGLAEPQL